MSAGAVREHALSLPGAWPDEPWEGDLVAKVGPGERGKIFAFLGGTSVGVKAGSTREEADEWLARYPDDAAVMGYIGRNGWNTLTIGGAIPLDALLEDRPAGRSGRADRDTRAVRRGGGAGQCLRVRRRRCAHRRERLGQRGVRRRAPRRHDEDILLSFDMFTSAQDVALIQPLPAKAELDVADVDTLGQLHRATAPGVVERRVLRGLQFPVIGGAAGDGARAGQPPGVRVREERELEPFTATRPYLREGWVIAAIKLTAGPASPHALNGELQPIRAAFPSREIRAADPRPAPQAAAPVTPAGRVAAAMSHPWVRMIG